MDLEGIMLSEISHTKTNTVWYHLYVESKKQSKLVNITERNRLTENKLVVSGGREKIGEEGDWEVQTTTYKINKLQGYIVQH